MSGLGHVKAVDTGRSYVNRIHCLVLSRTIGSALLRLQQPGLAGSLTSRPWNAHFYSSALCQDGRNSEP